MQQAQLTLPVAAALAASVLGGCGLLGPNSIKTGRYSYNDVIHQTSQDQLLLNIIRVGNDELPLFIDVTEVDATMQIQAGVNGGPTGIGARAGTGTSAGTLAGQLASVTGTVQYQESPTVRYYPLLGAALIGQLSTPISIDSIVALYDSRWALEPIISLIVDRLTPNYSNYSAAAHAIRNLQHDNALVIEAINSEQIVDPAKGQPQRATKNPPINITVMAAQQQTPQVEKQHNAIKFYFSPEGASNDEFECETRLKSTKVNIEKDAVVQWIRLLTAYNVPNVKKFGFTEADVHLASVSKLVEMEHKIIKIQDTLVLGGASSKADVPWIRTRSALGVLKALVTRNFAKVYSPEDATSLMNAPVNKLGACRLRELSNAEDAYVEPDKINRVPIYLLIQKSSTPPENAFSSAFYNGNYYYITNDDTVSKRTMSLLGLITVIQAKSDQGPVSPSFPIK